MTRGPVPAAGLPELLERLSGTRSEIARLVGDHVDAVVDPRDGSTTYLDGALREVLASGAAREREAAFRAAVLDALPANVAVLDQAGTIVAVNEAWRRFATSNGAPDGDAYVGANYVEAAAAATGSDAAIGQHVAERLRALLRGDVPRVAVEYTCHAPDQRRWFRMVATRPPHGSGIGAVVTHLDVSDVVRSQRVLRDGERRMAAILDALDEGVCAIDVDGRVALLNPAARRMLGIAEGHGVGARAAVVIRRFGADGAPVSGSDPLAVALREGRGTRVVDEWFERASGERFPVEYDVAPMRDATSAVVGVVLTFVDAGPRRSIEASLAAARRLEALGQLTGGVAHDFNNLLTVIGGNAELLVDTLPEGPQRRSAELIRVAAERGAAITQQLLAFGRRQSLDPEAVDLRSLAGDAFELLQHTAGSTVHVELAIDDEVWPVRADRARLETALLNLVANARDAQPRGGAVRVAVGNVTLGAADAASAGVAAPPPGDYVALSVTDDGVGIAAANLARVFEPFFSTKAPTKGAGLGLSMVHGFVHQSGGGIEVCSEPGAGTTVTMWLPRDPRQRAVVAEGGRPYEAPEPLADLGATVLVVDDDALVRAYASELLGRMGCVAVEAEGAAAALRVLEERDDVDLVFSDVVMPGPLDGYGLAAVVRDTWPHVRVVLTSGFDAQRAALDPDGDDACSAWPLVPKPYGREALAEAIAGALRRRSDG